MTTSLLNKIAKLGVEIHYLVGKHSSSVLKNNPFIKKITTFDETIIFNKRLLKLNMLRTQVITQNYDLVFILDKSYLANLFFLSTKIPVRIGFDRSGEGFLNTHNVIYDQKIHDIFAYLKLAGFLGIKSKDYQPKLYLSKEDEKFATNFFKNNKIKKPIIIAPGGANNPGQKLELKLWPKENYRELVKLLSKKHDIILVGSLSDEKISNFVSQNLKVHNLAGKTTIHQTASLMKKAKLIICNDSGPMHLASAVNKKILSLFFITNPKVLAPLHKQSKYLWKEKSACYDIYGNYDKCKGDENEKISVDEATVEINKLLK